MQSEMTKNTTLLQFVKYLRSTFGAASMLCATVPAIIGFVTPDMIPPWPSPAIAISIASGACGFVVLSLFFGIRHMSMTRKRKWGLFLFLTTALFFVLWVGSISHFVVPITEDYRVIKGFVLTPTAIDKIEEGTVENDPKKLLNAFGHQSAATVWIGVGIAQALVLVFFVLAFVAAAGTIAALALQRFR